MYVNKLKKIFCRKISEKCEFYLFTALKVEVFANES